jgi:hypothetical protein
MMSAAKLSMKTAQPIGPFFANAEGASHYNTEHAIGAEQPLPMPSEEWACAVS